MKTLLILLLLCGTAWAGEKVAHPGPGGIITYVEHDYKREDCDDWKNTGIPFWYGENAVARQSCRQANALEEIAESLNKIAERK